MKPENVPSSAHVNAVRPRTVGTQANEVAIFAAVGRKGGEAREKQHEFLSCPGRGSSIYLLTINWIHITCRGRRISCQITVPKNHFTCPCETPKHLVFSCIILWLNDLWYIFYSIFYFISNHESCCGQRVSSFPHRYAPKINSLFLSAIRKISYSACKHGARDNIKHKSKNKLLLAPFPQIILLMTASKSEHFELLSLSDPW